MSVAPVPQTSSSPQLPGLTEARFVAALVVVVYHLFCFDQWALPAPLARLIGHGPVAVGFFFCLSGFVLTHALGGDDTPTRRAGAFVVDRLWRLWPLHAFAVIIALPTAVALLRRGGVDDAVTTARHQLPWVLALLQAWSPSEALAINPPAWSLSCELFFSLSLWPLLGLLRRRGTAILVMVGVLSWLVSVGVGVAYLVVDPDGLQAAGIPLDHRPHAPEAWWLDALRYHPLVRWPEFVVGVIAALLWRRGSLNTFTSRPSARVVVTVMVLVVALLVPWPAPVSHNGLWLPLWVALIVALAGPWTAGPATAEVALRTPRIASRVLLLLGEASFALYLVHLPLLLWMVGLARARGAGPAILARPVVVIVALVACVVASLVVHIVVERPLLRWRRRRRARRAD